MKCYTLDIMSFSEQYIKHSSQRILYYSTPGGEYLMQHTCTLEFMTEKLLQQTGSRSTFMFLTHITVKVQINLYTPVMVRSSGSGVSEFKTRQSKNSKRYKIQKQNQGVNFWNFRGHSFTKIRQLKIKIRPCKHSVQIQ